MSLPQQGDVRFQVLHVLRGDEPCRAPVSPAAPMTSSGLHEEQTIQHGDRDSLPVEGVLVLLLYVSLLTDVLNIIKGRYRARNYYPVQESRPFRPLVSSMRKSCGMCQEKKSIRSLDVLWRRMRQATNQMRLINLRHHMITKVMMESRMEARLHEREKQQKKKEKLLGDILQSFRPSLVMSSNRFTDRIT
ncbi:hypothetical protein BaRGS_00004296 [Batillaria attramentaria]|uniref:Uncharacterized protein n=1 Tax=Batillaria attramentaria TaxID=370345 RepID=A0ABD0LY21_9CAEN